MWIPSRYIFQFLEYFTPHLHCQIIFYPIQDGGWTVIPFSNIQWKSVLSLPRLILLILICLFKTHVLIVSIVQYQDQNYILTSITPVVIVSAWIKTLFSRLILHWGKKRSFAAFYTPFVPTLAFNNITITFLLFLDIYFVNVCWAAFSSAGSC